MRVAGFASRPRGGRMPSRAAMTSSNVPISPVTPSLLVEYVDSSGVRQSTTVVDGVTSISGVAPFLVKFDASGTRSTVSTGNTADGAAKNIGYRINYGEALGTNWTYPEGITPSKDEDLGPPLFYRAFETTGTKTVQLRCKDSDGNESTISMSVVVAASSTLTTVNIPVSDGAWPTLVSSRRYTLDAGGSYAGFGVANFNGLHNIVIEKTGSGADPIMSICFDSRHFFSSGAERAANVRTQNIDVTNLNIQTVGFDYCGIINGRCRQLSTNPYGFVFDNDVSSEAEANSIRYPRAMFLWNCGETNSNGTYVWISSVDGGAWYGVKFNHNATGNEHCIRFSGTNNFAIRYSNFYNTQTHKTICKFQGKEYSGGGDPPTWRDDGRVGLYGTGQYGYPSANTFFDRVQFGASGEVIPETVIAIEPQNNDVDGTKEGVDNCGVENCVTYAADPESFGDTVNEGGRNLFKRNFKKSLGGGAEMGFATGTRPNKIPSGWDTGYLNESTNTRPVPTAF